MVFAGVVDGVFGDFHNQIFAGDFGLAAQAGIGFQAPCLIEQVFFQFGGFGQAVKTLAHDDVAGGAGTGFFAGVIDFDVVVEQHVKDGFAFGRVFDDCAFGT